MNSTEIPQKYQELQESIKTHGAQYLLGDRTKATRAFAYESATKGRHDFIDLTGQNIGNSKAMIFSDKPLIYCSTPNTSEGIVQEVDTNDRGHKLARLHAILSSLDLRIPVVLVGFSPIVVANIAKKHPKIPVWSLGKESHSHQLFPTCHDSDTERSIRFKGKAAPERSNFYEAELTYIDHKGRFHPTTYKSLDIPHFSGPVLEHHIQNDRNTNDHPMRDAEQRLSETLRDPEMASFLSAFLLCQRPRAEGLLGFEPVLAQGKHQAKGTTIAPAAIPSALSLQDLTQAHVLPRETPSSWLTEEQANDQHKRPAKKQRITQ